MPPRQHLECRKEEPPTQQLESTWGLGISVWAFRVSCVLLLAASLMTMVMSMVLVVLVVAMVVMRAERGAIATTS